MLDGRFFALKGTYDAQDDTFFYHDDDGALVVRFESVGSYSPGNYGSGFADGWLVVTVDGETVRIPALSEDYC